MAYRPQVCVKVEALGATWWLAGSDADNASLLSLLMQQGETMRTLADLPESVIATLCEFFYRSVRRWSGVLAPEPLTEDEAAGYDAEAAWPCTPENVALIPVMDKVSVMVAYITAVAEALGNGVSAPGVATMSTAPGAPSTATDSASASPSTVTTAPVVSLAPEATPMA